MNVQIFKKKKASEYIQEMPKSQAHLGHKEEETQIATILQTHNWRKATSSLPRVLVSYCNIFVSNLWVFVWSLFCGVGLGDLSSVAMSYPRGTLG